ncbi:MAG TPA: GntR family transcriptional regulator [Mycobacterium sp.]|jgi:DNA-binding FadR family transcriptional regulator|nr:GntR family transcriptional regulator [Mycobacterium sp.]
MSGDLVARTDVELFRPARPRRAFDEIIDQVRQLIDDGQLSPGDRLPPERVLAEQFAVSRNTVREAFRMLEISGVITLRRGQKGGAVITQSGSSGVAASISQRLSLTDFSLEDLTDCMRWLCGLVVHVAGPKLTPEDFAALEANTQAGAQLTDAASRGERALVLLEFYNILANATDNPVLAVLVESLTSILRSLIPRLDTPNHQFVIRARRKMIRLLKKGEFEVAADELDGYLVKLHARWLKADDGRAIHTVPILAGQPG